jgi:tetratricopeptide (TPR) repeat protein
MLTTHLTLKIHLTLKTHLLFKTYVYMSLGKLHAWISGLNAHTFMLILFIMLLQTACATTASVSTSRDSLWLFHDELFSQDVFVPASEAIFALSDEDKSQLKRAFLSNQNNRYRPQAAHVWLGQYINAHKGGFTYQDNVTQIADITMGNKQGNCMSLVVLTASLAQALGIPVQIQEVEVEPIWDRRGGFYLVNGHVNIKLLAPVDSQSISVTKSEILVDFLPERAVRGYRATEIDKQRLIAMFYNNIAAEALVVGDYDKAYQFAKQAIEIDSNYVSAVNTLAVIYRHKGHEDFAEQAYRYGLSIESDDLVTLYNLALILGAQDRLDEWAQVHKKLELARIANPFYYFDVAQQAYFDKEYQRALTWYKRAVEKADYRHEFYFGLSRAYWATGDERRAMKNMQKAIALSAADNKQRYQSKLNAMKH